ncbi:lipocalin family protein [Polaribacter sp. SA4-12]|uniref:lipocalin family protein n=1 Tax=Polaribacter sp. SA4-12 TaxID=1312072 RepID=UPI000B3CADFE|nr:lipocalin family protein [Polaribacter sp. SA4-12]ARV13737.1 hypothetical protein BTO07_00645 [Polaribacter sp. SA4-12]
MKKTLLIIGILSGIFFISCSSEDNINESELLTQKSPWTYNYYEMLSFTEKGNSDFTKEDVENNENQSNNGRKLIFNDDGTGSTFIPNGQVSEFNWEIYEQDLRLTFNNGTSNTSKILKISSAQLVIQAQEASYDNVADFLVLHEGKIFYK